METNPHLHSKLKESQRRVTVGIHNNTSERNLDFLWGLTLLNQKRKEVQKSKYTKNPPYTPLSWIWPMFDASLFFIPRSVEICILNQFSTRFRCLQYPRFKHSTLPQTANLKLRQTYKHRKLPKESNYFKWSEMVILINFFFQKAPKDGIISTKQGNLRMKESLKADFTERNSKKTADMWPQIKN